MRGRAHLKARLAGFAEAAAKRPDSVFQPMEALAMGARGTE
jgi:hypothetical protein